MHLWNRGISRGGHEVAVRTCYFVHFSFPRGAPRTLGGRRQDAPTEEAARESQGSNWLWVAWETPKYMPRHLRTHVDRC